MEATDGAEIHFSEAMLERFRARLRAERRAAALRLERTMRDARSAGGVGRGDEGDRAAEAAETNRLFEEARKERNLIREIDAAWARLDRNEFGRCEGTGAPIDPGRLDLRPWARYSRAYLELIESARR